MNDADLVRVLKALADPIRFRMVQAIAVAGELSCAQIGEHFEVTQPTISHHLKILTDADVLVRRTEGKQHFTSVNQRLLEQVAHLIPTRLAPTARSSRRA